MFADIVNVLLFDGKDLVAEDELEQGRERGDYVGEKGLREHERDSSKYWRKNKLRIAFFGFENQTEAEDDMPYRVIGYDGAAYRDQMGYHTDSEGNQRKNEERYPVVTLVLYLGYEHPWDKARSICGALGDRVTDELRPFVQDYGLNIFDIAFLSDEKVAKFKSDFRILADFLVQMRKNREYVPSEQAIVHVREVLNLMSQVTDDVRFHETITELEEGEEVRNMCTVLDKVENRGRIEGEKEGRKEGQQETSMLMAFLAKNNRSDDIIRASSDQAFFEQLLGEFRNGLLANH